MNDAVLHLRQAIAEGKHWYVALLEAIGLWRLKEETYNGRRYEYLIGGEAFDWLLLAERLCDEVPDLIPEDQRDNLLFGELPIRLSKSEFKSLIGQAKYRAYLNYFYGVIVEQALHLLVESEVEKEQVGRIRRDDRQLGVFERIYGESESRLLERFRRQNGYKRADTMSIAEFNEFTYWLFKYRLANCDSARVASDTKRALELLEEVHGDRIEF